jgi:putative PIN family toxin of toxin-antitoxin system
LIKIVLDTNVLISAVVFGGKPRQILELVIEGKLKLFLSDPILEEFKEVIGRSKFNYPSSMVHFIINELLAIANLVDPREKLELIEKDPQDNRIMECAIETNADFIISGDKHLLEFNPYKGIKILPPNEFLSEMNSIIY